MTSAACCIFLGLLFCTTALLKLTDLPNFKEYLDQFPFLRSSNRNLATICVSLEFAFGLSLLLLWRRELTLSLALAVLLLLSLLTMAGLLKYNIETCGCYGRHVRLTPWQSIKLNVAYFMIALIGLVSAP